MMAMLSDGAVDYAEDHCALRWPLLVWGLVAPAALMLATVVFGLTISPYWFIAVPFVLAFAPFLISIGLLYRNWPTGIRIDGTGIRIGAVRSARAARRTPTLTHQNWGLFICPWSGIGTLTVVTEPAQLRRIRTAPQFHTLSNRWGKPRTMTQCMLGVLSPPFMHAALLVEVDPAQASVPTTRASVFFPNRIGRPLTTRLEPRVGTVWVVPTRHPDRLRRAVDQLEAGRLR
jgi:hypothetical protein